MTLWRRRGKNHVNKILILFATNFRGNRLQWSQFSSNNLFIFSFVFCSLFCRISHWKWHAKCKTKQKTRLICLYHKFSYSIRIVCIFLYAKFINLYEGQRFNQIESNPYYLKNVFLIKIRISNHYFRNKWIRKEKMKKKKQIIFLWIEMNYVIKVKYIYLKCSTLASSSMIIFK